MRQLLYISSPSPRHDVDLESVLAVSRRRNAQVGITGLLYADGGRFLQVLEGEAGAVAATFDRIRADPRHQAVVVLSDRTVGAREFGDWAMAHRAAGGAPDTFDTRLERLLADASPSVRGTFQGLIAARRAA